MRNRLFLLGGSFTCNLYKGAFISIKKGITCEESRDPIQIYIESLLKKNLEVPLWFDDYLKLWGYEIYNFGMVGCTNESVYYQFTNIDKEYIENDRIIIHYTGLNRFDWITSEGKNIVVTGNPGSDPENPVRKMLLKQSVRRELSAEGGHLDAHVIPFMKYLLDVNIKYKPILWLPSTNLSNKFSNSRWLIWDPTNDFYKNVIPEFHFNKLTIYQETNGDIPDYHLSRYGNYYAALIFDCVLRHTKDVDYGLPYLQDKILIEKINETLIDGSKKFIE